MFVKYHILSNKASITIAFDPQHQLNLTDKIVKE